MKFSVWNHNSFIFPGTQYSYTIANKSKCNPPSDEQYPDVFEFDLSGDCSSSQGAFQSRAYLIACLLVELVQFSEPTKKQQIREKPIYCLYARLRQLQFAMATVFYLHRRPSVPSSLRTQRLRYSKAWKHLEDVSIMKSEILSVRLYTYVLLWFTSNQFVDDHVLQIYTYTWLFVIRQHISLFLTHQEHQAGSYSPPEKRQSM